MRAGAVEYLLRPIANDELIQALTKVGRFWFTNPPRNKSGENHRGILPDRGCRSHNGSRQSGSRACLGQHQGCAGGSEPADRRHLTFLDVNPSYTLSSVTTNIARLDANFLMGVMTRDWSGPYVLTEPTELDEAIDITPEQINRLLQFLKGIFDYVVVDCGGQLAGCTMAILENANMTLFTMVLSLPTIKTAKRYLTAMERKGIRKDRLKLIVNRYLPKADIQIKDAERVLGHKVFITVPNDYEDIISSINKGIPLIKLMPRSRQAKPLKTWSAC